MRTLGKITIMEPMDVRNLLRIGKRKCTDLFHASDFPAIQLGRNLYVQQDALNDYLSKKTPV